MGNPHHLEVVRRHRALFRGPCLEVGSKDYGSTAPLRTLFGDEEYLGVDMEAGDGVDQVLDLTGDFAEVDAALEGRRFGSVFCLCVLEHCRQPFRMAENLTRLLRPDGLIYVSVPFAWEFHGYPSDYWRFTHEGVKQLFPDVAFDADVSHAWAECRGGAAIEHPLDADIAKVRLSGRWHRERGRAGDGLGADLLRSLGGWGPFRFLTRYAYVLRPTNLDLVGRRRTAT